MARGKKFEVENSSICELKRYLKEHEDISQDLFNKIQEKINKEKITNIEFNKKILNSKIFQLAKKQMIREGKAEKVRLGETFIYDVDPDETFLKIHDIIVNAENRKIKLKLG